MITINVAEDFSNTPGGRTRNHGPYSGEEFLEKILIPKYKEAKKNNDILQINLDGCLGYPSSFLNEAFGGLAISEKSHQVLDIIELICTDDPKTLEDIKKDVSEAEF